jgi:hypothetical protein
MATIAVKSRSEFVSIFDSFSEMCKDTDIDGEQLNLPGRPAAVGGLAVVA